MNNQALKENVQIVTKELFFRPDENVHIQMSNEFPDYVGIMHKHEFIEIVYIISGQAIHKVAGKTYNVKRGDLFIVNSGTAHAFFEDNSSQEPFVAYDLMFTPEFFGSEEAGNFGERFNKYYMFYSLFGGEKALPPFFSVTGSIYSAFGELFNKIYLEHRGREKGYTEIIRAYLLQLIITIFRLDEERMSRSGNTRNSQAIDYITNYIKENYNSHISVAELAKMVYLSPDYLGKIFRKSTGVTISMMIQKVRIEKVCHYLATTEYTVAKIADLCGFDDMNFFYKTFKKHMGLLPNEFRNNIQSAKKA